MSRFCLASLPCAVVSGPTGAAIRAKSVFVTLLTGITVLHDLWLSVSSGCFSRVPASRDRAMLTAAHPSSRELKVSGIVLGISLGL